MTVTEQFESEGIGELDPTRPNVTRYRGAFGAARSLLVTQIATGRAPLLVVCKNRSAAEEILADLAFFLPQRRLRSFPGWETLPFELVSPSVDVSAQRLRTLYELSCGSNELVVASADALLYTTPSQEFLRTLTITLTPTSLVGLESVQQALRRAGYLDVSLVEAIGEMSSRGLVIDFFPSGLPHPVRIEFEAQRISSLRFFDADTQRSLGECESVTILPIRDYIPLLARTDFKHLVAPGVERIKARGVKLETPMREITRISEAFAKGAEFPGIELISALALEQRSSFFDFLPPQTHVVLIDGLGVQQALDTLSDAVDERLERLSREHYLIPERSHLYLNPSYVLSQLKNFSRSTLDNLDVFGEEDEAKAITVHVRSEGHTELVTRLKVGVGSGEAFKPLAAYLNRHRKRGYDACFVVGSQQRAERLQRTLLGLGFDARILDSSAPEWMRSPNRYPVVILLGHLSDGFILHDQQLLFIAEHEVFTERSYRSSKRAKTSLKRLLGTLALLKEGDFLVHTDYGIGRYCGLVHREVEDNESDFLHIEYADSVLYLPVQHIGKIQKFVAAEGDTPALDKLSSTRWAKTKQSVREQVATLAGDLIKLYAARSVAKGWRFEPYGAEDERFAEQFPYDETTDQLKAIQESLADLSNDRPMDRLVCGDVGFGKTEVAIRAAYKCVQHARQAAVLVPTTILAEQHYRSFQNRFQGYPTQIGLVSRFHTAQENRDTLKKLASGELDIIVGTHRLLSRDVVFKDLGLLVIDEEHRFGVQQKERLKALKRNVDVLTLTATPIPRTLHMSLLGIRDISLISTPPVDRRVIRTYVANYDEGIVRDVLLRELQRGGQAFYLHNRVQNIEAVTSALQQLVPEARFAFAHGQMSDRQLEPIMQKFLDREVDVLVATSIIESGIDIPNANTILIDRADTFGLAQLYQLRGRVGRSSRQAYCYFLIPKAGTLGAEAQQRLKALQALDDLGLGFNLAMRDLEIRGAGNLLGKEQSGSVLAVGFELYSKILKEAVLNLKGEEVDFKETIDPEVKVGVSAFIPETYLPDISERLVLYQRFAAISSVDETDLLLEEIRDRFGPPTRETVNLAELMRLRALLREYGVVKAELSKGRLALSFSPNAPIDIDSLLKLEQTEPLTYRLGKSLTLSVAVAFTEIENPKELFPIVSNTLSLIGRKE